MTALPPTDPFFAGGSERRWRARIAAFAPPALYVPSVTPPTPGTLVALRLRDRAEAVGEVLWSRREMPLAGAAVRWVGRGPPAADAGAELPENAWEALLASPDCPALPEAAAQVLRATGSERTGAAELARAVERDLKLSEAVLALANSANFRARERLTDCRAAVVRLGIERVRSLVLATSVFRLFPADRTDRVWGSLDPRVSPSGLWTHALASAFAAEALARSGGLPAEDAFLAGLFHDLGKLLLARALGGAYRAVLDQVEEWTITLEDAERAVLGFSHAKAGAWLLSRWGLSASVVNAVADHHRLRPGRERSLAAAAHAGDLVARSLAAGTTADRRMPGADPSAWAALGIGLDDISGVVARAASAIAAGWGAFEQAGVRPPFVPRSGQATEADPILREAASASAARRREELFSGEAPAGSGPHLSYLRSAAEEIG
jgi:putative nucleotidyltransferase with HDIG domain